MTHLKQRLGFYPSLSETAIYSSIRKKGVCLNSIRAIAQASMSFGNDAKKPYGQRVKIKADTSRPLRSCRGCPPPPDSVAPEARHLCRSRYPIEFPSSVRSGIFRTMSPLQGSTTSRHRAATTMPPMTGLESPAATGAAARTSGRARRGAATGVRFHCGLATASVFPESHSTLAPRRARSVAPYLLRLPPRHGQRGGGMVNVAA
jgi:hypothetical protein